MKTFTLVLAFAGAALAMPAAGHGSEQDPKAVQSVGGHDVAADTVAETGDMEKRSDIDDPSTWVEHPKHWLDGWDPDTYTDGWNPHEFKDGWNPKDWGIGIGKRQVDSVVGHVDDEAATTTVITEVMETVYESPTTTTAYPDETSIYAVQIWGGWTLETKIITQTRPVSTTLMTAVATTTFWNSTANASVTSTSMEPLETIVYDWPIKPHDDSLTICCRFWRDHPKRAEKRMGVPNDVCNDDVWPLQCDGVHTTIYMEPEVRQYYADLQWKWVEYRIRKQKEEERRKAEEERKRIEEEERKEKKKEKDKKTKEGLETAEKVIEAVHLTYEAVEVTEKLIEAARIIWLVFMTVGLFTRDEGVDSSNIVAFGTVNKTKQVFERAYYYDFSLAHPNGTGLSTDESEDFMKKVANGTLSVSVQQTQPNITTARDDDDEDLTIHDGEIVHLAKTASFAGNRAAFKYTLTFADGSELSNASLANFTQLVEYEWNLMKNPPWWLREYENDPDAPPEKKKKKNKKIDERQYVPQITQHGWEVLTGHDKDKKNEMEPELEQW